MNLKASKRGFKMDKYESKLLRSLLRHWLSWLIIVAFGLNKKKSVVRNFYGGEGVKYFETSIP